MSEAEGDDKVYGKYTNINYQMCVCIISEYMSSAECDEECMQIYAVQIIIAYKLLYAGACSKQVVYVSAIPM